MPARIEVRRGDRYTVDIGDNRLMTGEIVDAWRQRGTKGAQTVGLINVRGAILFCRIGGMTAIIRERTTPENLARIEAEYARHNAR